MKRGKTTNPIDTFTVSKDHCKTSRLGCFNCDELMCKECWEHYEHDPQIR